MNTKLTLNIDNDIISKAKEYAYLKKVSLSKLIEEYLKSLILKKDKEKVKLSPITKELTQIIKKRPTKEYKEILADALLEKYK